MDHKIGSIDILIKLKINYFIYSSIRIWNLETFENENTLEAHLETVTALALNEDETILASGSED